MKKNGRRRRKENDMIILPNEPDLPRLIFFVLRLRENLGVPFFFLADFLFSPLFFASLNVTDKLPCLLRFPSPLSGRKEGGQAGKMRGRACVSTHLHGRAKERKEKNWRGGGVSFLGRFLPEGGRILLLAEGGGGSFQRTKRRRRGWKRSLLRNGPVRSEEEEGEG